MNVSVVRVPLPLKVKRKRKIRRYIAISWRLELQ